MSAQTEPPARWSALLADAVSTPGVISEAYRRFWNYSVGNQLLARWQCFARKVPLGPITTFMGWKDLGRSVRKGEKALVLCMPVIVKHKEPPLEQSTDDTPEELPRRIRRFVYRARWFTLSQTDGELYVPQELPEWSEERALSALGITRVEFDHSDGNVQGYAIGLTVSVSPIGFEPHRTLFHELAHVILGHTIRARLADEKESTKGLREVEAESVALICCESLGLPGAEHSRGYIQHWLRNDTIPERSAHHIFGAADKILRAGRPENQQVPDDSNLEISTQERR